MTALAVSPCRVAGCSEDRPEMMRKRATRPSGLDTICRPCNAAATRARRAADPKAARAAQKAHAATPKALATRKAYRATPEARAAQKARDSTPEARADRKAYNATPARRTAQKARAATPEARAAQKARDSTPEARAAKKDLTLASQTRWATEDPFAKPTPKRCPACRQHRPRRDFSTAPSASDGLSAYCLGCCASRSSERRAKVLDQWVEHVSRDVLWTRDQGICYLCELPADPADWHLEHVHPIDNGGEHSYINTAVSHPFCNLSKGAKPWPNVAFTP